MEKIYKGRRGEEIARKWVEKHLRMKILEVNFRSPWGEVDLVGRDGESFVFIEVKTRFGIALGLPEEAVGTKKQEKIRKVAEFYLLKNGYHPDETLVRFDVVAIQMEKDKPKITYYRGAF